MSATDMKIEQAALDWLVRVNDPAFDQWDAWEAWLAADARHAETYWRLAEAEGEAVEALKSAPPRRAAPVIRRGVQFPLPRRAVMAAAVGALAVGLGWIGWTQTPRPWSVETAPGEQRTVSLADGSKITLDGGTRLSMDRRKPREVTLEGGRALFDVVHDDARPFIVGVGEAILTDLGTVFDVTHLQNGARVAVSEGSVRVDARGDTATLNPGDSVVASPRGLERRPVDIEAVDDWREGRLSWNGERLDVVAQDLARALNRPIRIAPALAGRSFSGSLNIGPDARDQRERIALLLGVTVIEDGEGWRLEP
ncbi:FecR domain-containing protein [Brevundimonas sp. M20]|uniref:FecR family protein n=1 Tax=Brevundimonas sp. M20 TaxID=2591463 RepID=UPI0011478417|nr:FecR domain-containing protein [Brevundimonas sp. M20]QDH74025.1 iron dicitrate transport regulator FecR [Brevundimonas sp. M20]